MPKRPCLGCNRLTEGSRCPDCQRLIDTAMQRAKRSRRPYTPAERKRRAEAVAAHRAEHGNWCPGWQRDPHPSADLTADHVVPVGAGGPEDGPLIVRCRRCNSARGANL
jgi:5-methylcytosine-specific restriction enzyme A